jgi:hypothetical protein
MKGDGMGSESYPASFFAGHHASSLASAGVIVPRLLEVVQPASVIDVGCGDGEWLSVFQQHGVRILGVDGFGTPPFSEFIRTRLDRVLPDLGDYDLAVSVEVAEHLPESRARSFVRDLTRLSGVVAFSAAIPGQRGDHHVNEQWPDYWADLFGEVDYACCDIFRRALWQEQAVQWWYAQNLLLFVRRDQLSRYSKISSTGRPDRLVHPNQYETVLENQTHSISSAAVLLKDAAKRSLRRRLAQHLR